MMTLSIALNVVIAIMCLGGMIWEEYKDNFGERMGMAAIGIVCVIRAGMASDFNIAERSDILLEIGIILYGWGQLCAKLANRRRRVAESSTQRA